MFSQFIKISSTLIFLVACGHRLTNSVQDTSSGNNNDEYKLVWSDEFENSGLPDSANWRYEHGFVRNEELQWYHPENARCENGYLIIEAKREQKPNPGYEAGNNDWRKKREMINYTSK